MTFVTEQQHKYMDLKQALQDAEAKANVKVQKSIQMQSHVSHKKC